MLETIFLIRFREVLMSTAIIRAGRGAAISIYA